MSTRAAPLHDRLAACPAFAGLDTATLEALARQAELLERAQGEPLIAPGDGGRMYALLDGSVRVDGVAGADGVDRRIVPGEVFPLAALIARRGVSSAHAALEATCCASWPSEVFETLYRDAPTFRAHCAALIERMSGDALARLRQAHAQPGDALLSTPLVELGLRAPVTVDTGTALRDALAAMRDERVGSVVIVDAMRRPLAILTLRDVLERVAIEQPDLSAPAVAYASPLRWTAPARSPAMHAAMLMARHGVRHIPVVDGDVLVGVVSEGRLYALQHGGLRRVASRIRDADGDRALRDAGQDARALAATLAEQGSDPIELARLVSSLNDAICARALAMAADTHPPPGVRWCWIALGSEGREEQTLATDQDNGLVFETVPGADPDTLRRALLPFARETNRLLDVAGYPLCRGDVMAGNPSWCMSVDEWRARFAAWITRPEPQPLLDASIFFDLRAIEGDASLARALRDWLAEVVPDDERFLFLMTRNALDNAPPLGLIRDFVVAHGGAHPGTLDLKVNGVQPFVEAARILALAAGVRATGTVDRLREAGAARGVPTIEVQAWIEAFRFLQGLRLRLNAAQWRDGEPTHNHLDPASLNELDRQILKESFRQARRLQTRLAREHGGGAIALR